MREEKNENCTDEFVCTENVLSVWNQNKPWSAVQNFVRSKFIEYNIPKIVYGLKKNNFQSVQSSKTFSLQKKINCMRADEVRLASLYFFTRFFREIKTEKLKAKSNIELKKKNLYENKLI